MLPLPATDLEQLRTRVRALSENRPGVYQMTDATGRVLYVGKAKRVRTRLLSYFRASYPEDKAARILYATHDIRWRYVPSEFAAFLTELRQIRQHRPHFNYQLNHSRRPVLIAVSGGRAPRVRACRTLAAHDVRAYGPFQSLARAAEAVRTLNDLLGLRDCAETMPMVFAGQGDLFGTDRRAACARHEFGFCSGPCAGFVAEWEYRRRVETATAFLEGRTIQPMDRVIEMMSAAAGSTDFELAARWREIARSCWEMTRCSSSGVDWCAAPGPGRPRPSRTQPSAPRYERSWRSRSRPHSRSRSTGWMKSCS